MTDAIFSEVMNSLKNAKKVLLSLHLGPDGDSLGSCLALEYVLKRDFGVSVTIISKDSLEAGLMSTDFVKNIRFGEGIEDIDLSTYDLVILPDSGSLKQFASPSYVLPLNIKTISIDHHATNDRFCIINYVDVTKISCCSILLEFFKEMKVTFDSELSTRLLLGIFTDSGWFAHGSGQSLVEAGFLIEHGADFKKRISDPIRFTVPLRVKKYYALMAQKFTLVSVNGLRVGYSTASHQEIAGLQLSLAEARGAINDLQTIGDVDIIFTLTEMEHVLKGSFRSRKGIDISKYAEALGGGGHKAAAAFKLPPMNLDEAVKNVLETIKKMPVVRV